MWYPYIGINIFLFMFSIYFLYNGLFVPKQIFYFERNLSRQSIDQKVILIVIDGLGFQMAKNNFPLIKKYQNNSNTIFSKCYADPPTVTSQRIRALMGGLLPNFIEITNNFYAQQVVEDNLLKRLKMKNKKTIFMGDDTWVGYYNKFFQKTYPCQSFNVADYTTCDQIVQNNLLKIINSKNWDFIIGVDHIGHTFSSSQGQIMNLKLKNISQYCQKVIKSIDQHSTLILISDHGLLPNGNHGGDNSLQTDSFLFAFRKNGFIETENKLVNLDQLDLTTTLSFMLNVPIPSNSIGILKKQLLSQKHKEFLKEYQEQNLKLNKQFSLLIRLHKFQNIQCKAQNLEDLQQCKQIYRKQSNIYDSYSLFKGFILLFCLFIFKIPIQKSKKLFIFIGLILSITIALMHYNLPNQCALFLSIIGILFFPVRFKIPFIMVIQLISFFCIKHQDSFLVLTLLGFILLCNFLYSLKLYNVIMIFFLLFTMIQFDNKPFFQDQYVIIYDQQLNLLEIKILKKFLRQYYPYLFITCLICLIHINHIKKIIKEYRTKKKKLFLLNLLLLIQQAIICIDQILFTIQQTHFNNNYYRTIFMNRIFIIVWICLILCCFFISKQVNIYPILLNQIFSFFVKIYGKYGLIQIMLFKSILKFTWNLFKQLDINYFVSVLIVLSQLLTIRAGNRKIFTTLNIKHSYFLSQNFNYTLNSIFLFFSQSITYLIIFLIIAILTKKHKLKVGLKNTKKIDIQHIISLTKTFWQKKNEILQYLNMYGIVSLGIASLLAAFNVGKILTLYYNPIFVFIMCKAILFFIIELVIINVL